MPIALINVIIEKFNETKVENVFTVAIFQGLFVNISDRLFFAHFLTRRFFPLKQWYIFYAFAMRFSILCYLKMIWLCTVIYGSIGKRLGWIMALYSALYMEIIYFLLNFPKLQLSEAKFWRAYVRVRRMAGHQYWISSDHHQYFSTVSSSATSH